MATVEQQNDQLAMRCGEYLVDRDRAIARADQLQAELSRLEAETDKRLELVDTIKHGGIRQLFAVANDSRELARIVGHFRTSTKCYSELKDLIDGLLAKSDEYEAAAEIEDWHQSWNEPRETV